MEAFKNPQNETSKRRSSPEQNLPENDDQLKKMSIIPEDANEDLHIVGLKVQLEDDEAYTFAIAQPNIESADVSTVPAGSVKLIDRQCNHGQDIASIPSSAYFQNQATSTRKADNEKHLATPAIEMKFGPNCAVDNDFEIHIKTRGKSRTRSTLDEDKQCLGNNCRAEDTVSCIADKNAEKNASHSVKYLKVSPDIINLERVTELSFAGTQTESRRNACTETEGRNTDSKETETDVVSKRQAAVQTERERASASSQTETAAVFAIEKEYSASTQTEQVQDAAVSTDRDVVVVEREDMRDASADTEDLVFVPLMLAKAERAQAEKEQSCEKHCRCSSAPPDRQDHLCCYHRNRENIYRDSAQCQLFQTIPKYMFCICSLKRNCCENSDKCVEKQKNNAPKSYCCKCGRNAKSDSKMPEEDFAMEKIEPLSTIRVDSNNFSSVSREKNHDKSQLEVVKRLKSYLKNAKACTAVKKFKSSKVENASPLRIPVFIQHRLTSFSVSILAPSRVVVNPMSINFHKKQRTPGKEDTHQTVRSVPDRGLNDISKSSLLLLSDPRKKKSVTVNYIPPSASTVQDMAPSQVCLCNECYLSVQNAVQKKKNRLPENAGKSKAEKCTPPPVHKPASTSPKIKHKTFNYASKDTWEPYGQKRDEFVCKDTEATDIISVGYSSSEESFESASTVNISDACEAVNNHLLSLRPVDEDTVHEAAKVLHRLWFETAARKSSDVREVRNCMEYFEEFSNNLLKTLLHSVDNSGNNVFHFAFANNRFDLVEELLRKGFTKELLNKINKNGNSPLLICSISRPKSPSDWLTVRKCFEMGDVNAKSAKIGQTPLMNAASSGFHRMVDLLLDAGADPNLQDKDGSTALMYAAEHGHEKCIQSLMQHKRCDPTVRDKDGQTACSIALDSGQQNIALLIHLQALEKRRQTERSHCSKRYVWTNINNKDRKRALSMMPRSHSWESH